MPKKPDIDLGTLDVPAGEVSVANTGNDDPPRRAPLMEFDKATAIKPADWEKVQVYIHSLRSYAEDLERRCGGGKSDATPIDAIKAEVVKEILP